MEPTKTPEKHDITVLYVEDEENIRDSLARILRRKVRDLHTAENGQVGLEKFREIKPDIIVTDIRMPVMSGLQMSREIRRIDPGIPIIVTTAFTDVDHFIEAIEIGVTRFILKPVDTDRLMDAIAQSGEIISTRKELEKQKVLLNQYKHAMDVSNVVSKIDLQGNFIYVNDHFCEVSGYAREELIGRPYTQIYHPSTKKEEIARIWEQINQKKIWRGILENRKKDGESFWVDIKVIPFLDENDDITEFIAIRTDITELVEKERELEQMRLAQMKQNIEKASDIKLENIIKSIPTPAVIVDEKNIALIYNAEFENLFDMYEDREQLNRLKEGTLCVCDLFVDDEEHLTRDGLVDWKALVSEIGNEEGYTVKIHVGGSDKVLFIMAQKVEKMGEETRFVICFSKICHI